MSIAINCFINQSAIQKCIIAWRLQFVKSACEIAGVLSRVICTNKQKSRSHAKLIKQSHILFMEHIQLYNMQILYVSGHIRLYILAVSVVCLWSQLERREIPFALPGSAYYQNPIQRVTPPHCIKEVKIPGISESYSGCRASRTKVNYKSMRTHSHKRALRG